MFVSWLFLYYVYSARQRPLTRLWTYAIETAASAIDDGAKPKTASSAYYCPKPSNISSPRLWLESEPDGAYSVVRCDRVWVDTFEDWIIWGEDFHCTRLCESYQLIFGSRSLEEKETAVKHGRPFLKQGTKSMLYKLLEYATKCWNTESSMMGRVYIVTLLAHPAKEEEASAVPIIKGHISQGPRISHPLIPLARHGIKVAIVDVIRGQTNFPNRLANPLAKNSAWCRIRRTIEAAVATNGPYDEIVMADGVQLLEGLTSNIFVVEQEGTMQGAPSNKVLNGYVRHCLTTQPNLKIKFEAPSWECCCNWRQLFTTSSIRLVVPVFQVYVSDTAVWEHTDPAPITNTLYKSLVLDQYTRAGHRRLCD